ncbi:MAG: lysophospholipase [Acholeplasmataceae bacterium]|jgi:alpha-beta hydrolase superfamily lysophospholipase
MLINNEFLYVKNYEVDNPKATVIFSHGIAEHHLRYKNLINYLNENEYNVLAYDLRGHGRSGGKRGYIKSYNVFVEDLNSLILYAKNKYKHKIFLIGHSLGALINNLYAVSKSKLDVDGIIASGTAGDFTKSTNFLRIFPGKLIGFLKIRTNFKDPNLYSDPTQVINFEKDDYLLDYFYLSLIDQTMIKGMRRLKKRMNQIEVPYLFIHGNEDRVVPPRSSENIYSKIRSYDKKRILYPGLKHNILNDDRSEVVYNDIVVWLDNRS